MLVLTRRVSESIVIANDITITVLRTCKHNTKLGINAPRDMPVNREEVYLRIQEERASGLTREKFLTGTGMLLLTRRIGESIIIGNDIKVTVLNTKGHQVKIGIEAPEDVKIYRAEIYEKIRAERLNDTKRKSSPVISGEIWDK